MCCLIEPECNIEIIEEPDPTTRVLKVLEPDAGKLARPVLRGGSCGNVTFLPDKGLYGSLGVDAIKARKGIPPKENLMDRMDTTELIANQFRMSQTREKLKRENIKNQRDAIETHEAVGKEVRAAIAKIGGTPPENIPPAEPIKNVEKRIKASKPLLTLNPKDADGLAPFNKEDVD